MREKKHPICHIWWRFCETIWAFGRNIQPNAVLCISDNPLAKDPKHCSVAGLHSWLPVLRCKPESSLPHKHGLLIHCCRWFLPFSAVQQRGPSHGHSRRQHEFNGVSQSIHDSVQPGFSNCLIRRFPPSGGTFVTLDASRVQAQVFHICICGQCAKYGF